MAGGINAEGGESAVEEAALGRELLSARRGVFSAGGVEEEVFDGEGGSVVEDIRRAVFGEGGRDPVLAILADVGTGHNDAGFDGAGSALVVATKGEDVRLADAGFDLFPRHGHGGVREILQAVQRVLVFQEFDSEGAEGATPPRGVKGVEVEGAMAE